MASIPLPISTVRHHKRLPIRLMALTFLVVLCLYLVVNDFRSWTAPESNFLYPEFYYSVFKPIPAPKEPPSERVLAPPTLECLEALVARGEPCQDRTKTTLDVVWTWVNSSDPLWRREHTASQYRLLGEEPPLINYTSPLAHFADFDELRYSIRSLLQHFRSSTANFHIVAADFPVPPETDTDNDTEHSALQRVGQMPQWLDPAQSYWKDGKIQLSVHHHANVFSPYHDTSFNSYAIESQFFRLQGVSDAFVYLNDDMYFMRNLAAADFYTPAYGLVLRFQSNLLVPSTPDPSPQRGEWQPLRQSNYLISERFAHRSRPYLGHVAKSASMPLLREMAAIWPEEFAQTASRQFREVWRNGADGDIHTMFLLSHFVVERWREALLWSWTVGRIGKLDDSWPEAEGWAALGGTSEPFITVPGYSRRTTEAGQIRSMLQGSGLEPSTETVYLFSSGDGYPYREISKGRTSAWPDYRFKSEVCTITRVECFGDSNSAGEIFKRIAFEKPECGDCVLNALTRNSGELGLSAFLPQKGRTVWPSRWGSAPSTLPLNKKWREADFRLQSVLSEAPRFMTIDVREWTMQLLYRYRFVIGGTQTTLLRLNDMQTAKSSLWHLDHETPPLLCMNDDVSPAYQGGVYSVLRQWQQKRWGQSATWERGAPTCDDCTTSTP
ncbi:hypothetical protein JAAARDRAFT_518082 [Jaapia argillacea MUCL 33604]|uniref:Stealth protein CR3 conserved region 3 domain-containing protein n=1 Tax=Jaapia argillacea MUCL 33604 TaxID=933084 RepID=A0A067Q646_9AGAM|nr:hypothetical protein JAAARDRAFT_518082 [Jaapia argillacea MUCL 33604]